MKKQYKWKSLYEQLKAEIEEGKYKKGSKFFTTFQLCEKFNISSITARRILYELERDGLIIQKKRVGAIINKIQKDNIYVYTPFKNRMEESKVSWIIVQILHGIIKNAEKYNLNIEYTHDFDVVEKNAGILLVIYDLLSEGNKLTEFLEKKNSNNIIILHTPKRIRNYHNVRNDLFKGAYIATRHLIEKGYKKIGHISGTLKEGWYISRFQGYLEAFKEFDIEFNKNLLKETSGQDYKEDEKAIEELLKERVDSVFCGNDWRALNILDYCNKKKIKVPEELGICGFDNIMESEKEGLTTVETHLEGVGEKAIELAMDIIEREINKRMDILIEPELIIRKTT